MLNEPIDLHLKAAIRILSGQGHQRQQMLNQTATSSSYITMVPTPGTAQSANGNHGL